MGARNLLDQLRGFRQLAALAQSGGQVGGGERDRQPELVLLGELERPAGVRFGLGKRPRAQRGEAAVGRSGDEPSDRAAGRGVGEHRVGQRPGLLELVGEDQRVQGVHEHYRIGRLLGDEASIVEAALDQRQHIFGVLPGVCRQEREDELERSRGFAATFGERVQPRQLGKDDGREAHVECGQPRQHCFQS